MEILGRLSADEANDTLALKESIQGASGNTSDKSLRVLSNPAGNAAGHLHVNRHKADRDTRTQYLHQTCTVLLTLMLTPSHKARHLLSHAHGHFTVGRAGWRHWGKRGRGPEGPGLAQGLSKSKGKVWKLCTAVRGHCQAMHSTEEGTFAEYSKHAIAECYYGQQYRQQPYLGKRTAQEHYCQQHQPVSSHVHWHHAPAHKARACHVKERLGFDFADKAFTPCRRGLLYARSSAVHRSECLSGWRMALPNEASVHAKTLTAVLVLPAGALLALAERRRKSTASS